MTQINPDFNNPFLFAQQLGQQQEAVENIQDFSYASGYPLPEIYQEPDSFEKKSFKETIKPYDMFNMVVPWFEHPLLMLGTFAGLSWGVDKFAQSCGGEYEKSLLGRAAHFGDSIENSKFIKSKPSQKVLGFLKSGGNRIKHFFRNSDVLNAIIKTPSLPEWMMPKDEMLKQSQRVVHEFSNIANTLKLGDDACAKITEIGLDKTDEAFLKKFFNTNNIKGISEEKLVNATLLNRLGKSSDEISSILNSSATAETKKEILKAMGLSVDDIKNLRGEISDEIIEKVLKATGKVKNKVRIGAGEYKWLGPFQPFKRFISCSEIYNKLYSMGDGAKTKTGRLLSKFLQKCYRGFTFGGGKLGVLCFVAPHLVETMKNVKKADPDQKVGTTVNGLVSSMSWVFTFPLALELMHRVGGMQYAGMGEEKVRELRNKLSEFNAKVTDKTNPDFFKDKAAYDKAREILEKDLKSLKKVDGQSLFTKICRKIGSFLTIDLERIKSFRNGNVAGNSLRRLPSIARNALGVPMRFAVWGVLCMGVIEPLISKSIKKVFGNYYDQFKEEEHVEKKKQQKQFLKDDLQARLIEANNAKYSQVQTAENNVENTLTNTAPLVQKAEETTPQVASAEPSKDFEQVEIPENKNLTQEILPSQNSIKNEILNTVEKQNPSTVSSPIKQSTENRKLDNYTYIPSSENVIQDPNKDVTINKYIPSQTAGNFTKTFDNSHLASALSRADRAEKRALEVLSGNFNNM